MVNAFFSNSVNKRKGSGCDSASFARDTGQIIMMTKMLTASDMEFYDFINARPILKWKSEASS